MNKLLVIIVLSLLLGGCSDPREKIYPKNGLFPKTQAKYELYCEVIMGPKQDLFKFDLTLDQREVTLKVHNAKKTFLVKDLYSHENGLEFAVDGDENYFYSDKLANLENKERFYYLDRNTGSFNLGHGEYGFCVEKGFGWKLNKIRTQYEYARN